jgi:hypothetical protein
MDCIPSPCRTHCMDPLSCSHAAWSANKFPILVSCLPLLPRQPDTCGQHSSRWSTIVDSQRRRLVNLFVAPLGFWISSLASTSLLFSSLLHCCRSLCLYASSALSIVLCSCISAIFPGAGLFLSALTGLSCVLLFPS